MISRCLIFLLVVSAPGLVAVGQGIEKTFFIDSCENFVDESHYTFRRVTRTVAGKPFEYEMVDYDRQGNIYTSGIVKSRNGVTRVGDYVFYRADGSVLARGSYDKGVPVGTWVYYSKSRQEVPIDSLMAESGIVRYEKDGLYREGKCICYVLNGDVTEASPGKELTVKTYRAGYVVGIDGVVSNPDKQATFIPDMKAFYDYFEDKLTYPFLTRLAAREGEVFVKFVVRKDGVISKVTFLKSLDRPTEKRIEETLRATSGRWKPGEYGGKVVDSILILPVIFKLKK